jgi:threonine aldolase
VSTAERIAAARVWRKRLGAGMRQVGILAAGGLHALDHHVDRLAEDHARARRLAEAVAAVVPTAVDPAAVATNIVMLDVPDAAALAAACREHGVAISVLGPRAARLVTHLDLDDDAVDRASDVLAKALVS